MAFDDMIEIVGGQHAYQIIASILMAYGEAINSLQSMQPILTASKEKYWCVDSTNASASFYGHSSNLSSRQNISGDLLFGQCSIVNRSSGASYTCDAWRYDTSRFYSTINDRYTLTCGRNALSQASTSIYFFGHLIGCSLYGSFSDRYGRLKMIMISALNIALFSVAAALVSSMSSNSPFWMYVVLRLITGIGVGGLFTISLTMEAEVTGPKHRVLFFMATHVGSSLGAILLSVLALWLRNHFWIQIAAAAPILLYVIYPFVLSESPRWLLYSKRIDHGERVLRRIGRINGRTVPCDFRERLQQLRDPVAGLGVCDPTVEEDTSDQQCQSNCQDTLLPLFKSKSLGVTTLLVWSCWFAANFGYCGSYFNVGEIGGNIFVNLIINSAMELPAHVAAFFLARRFGRRATMCVAFLGGGLCCLMNALWIDVIHIQLGIQILSMLSQFWFTAAYDTIIFYSCEMFPTVARNLAVGIGSTTARIGGLLAPQVTLLFHVWRPSPLLLLGFVSLTSSLIVLIFLPETRNHCMPETVEEWSKFVQTNRGVKLPRRSLKIPVPEVDEDEATPVNV